MNLSIINGSDAERPQTQRAKRNAPRAKATTGFDPERQKGHHEDIRKRQKDPYGRGPELSAGCQSPGRKETDALPETFFPVVGIGASAGGLEIFTRILQRLPARTGMSFVFVQHLAAEHASMLASLLSRTTTMPVTEAQHGTNIQPNHAYVIPPNTLMRIAQRRLELEPRPEERGAPRPIDHFFRSLAVEHKTHSIGVVLSGSDSDGTLGLQAIRAEGGITIVQSESSARHPEMPRAAIAAGIADLILDPEEIAAELERIGKHPRLTERAPAIIPEEPDHHESQMNQIFALLRAAGGVDFRGYKRGTMLRRVTRRMILKGQEDLKTYVSDLEANRSELLALCDDLLINVTGFFRDPEVFVSLETDILPRLFRERSKDVPLRVWVPGCSTGEEVYSLAMCLVESRSRLDLQFPIQIFGTDLSERAITKARTAIYTDGQVSQLTPERQALFFTHVEHGHQVVKSVREMCVFARQNLVTDPPFSRIDLISCRNVLIYLGPALQRQVIATFHYALNPKGYLMLGHSEGLRDFPDLFSVVDNQHRFFSANPRRAHLNMELIARRFVGEQPAMPFFLALGGAASGREKSLEAELEKAVERTVLSEYAPAWVVVDASFQIMHSRGDTSAYLQLAPGRATLDLLKMARDGIRGELRKLLTRARQEDGPVVSSVLKERDGACIRSVRIDVRRIAGSNGESSCFLVLFLAAGKESLQEAPPPARGRSSQEKGKTHATGQARLEQELTLTTQRLQAIIDERDAANQDLATANEEMQSSNEELQSINEELETSKEELQSSHEELNTVNEELQNRNRELNRLSDDLENLFASTTIPILMLDSELRIRRMTATAERLFNVRSTDIGRPIGEIRIRLSVDDLEALVRRVIGTLNAEQLELQDQEGCWHLLRVQPYRTAENRIEGAVLALIDIDQLRRARIDADAAREFAEAVVDSVQTPLLVLRPDLRIRVANRAFLESYGLQHADVENRLLCEVSTHWNLPALRTALQQLSTNRIPVDNLELEQEFPASGKRTVLLNAREIQAEGATQILVAAADITAQKRAQRILVKQQERLQLSVQVGAIALERSREELGALTASLLHTQDEERRRVSRELHDELSQKMAKLQFDVETLEQQLPSDLKEGKRQLMAIRDEVGALSNDVRRIAYQLHPSTLDHLGLSVALRSYCREFRERERIPVQFAARKVARRIAPEIASCLYRVVQEALRNIAKHAGKTKVKIILAGTDTHLSLSIRDNGVGFERQPVQGNGGLGLISMEERVRLVNGSFSLEARRGHGVHIRIQVPLHQKKESNATATASGG